MKNILESYLVVCFGSVKSLKTWQSVLYLLEFPDYISKNFVYSLTN